MLVDFGVIDKQAKNFLAILLLVAAAGIGIFTLLQEKGDDKISLLMQEFTRGKDLSCKDGKEKIIVNNKGFIISGTLTFVGIEGSENYRKIVPIRSCEIAQ